ncbi:single-stranded DNA-binding protein [Streptomyces botrytidirepellens]|uniref:Single-stranded DNA-binding protein n=1 Tax=Streptomyces botrytidirepellens TaxID=2486417 RepID=A0A3M8UEB8_9ACTN|nr:single-stranded DNA-binding protein [Streptomyces botrytidirepellens]RNG03800.1 single-stranded DNA-binding protein [Streptomyces botrytidirepellens]
MNETWTTVVGNAATRPDFWETAAGVAVARFRLAATVRRWDRKSEGWVDAYTSFYTVWTWRTLAANVAASVSLGEPLLVHGTLRVREREKEREREKAPQGTGESGPRRWITAEIDAVAVGHDLTRGTSAFRRVSQAKPLLNVPTGATAR